MTIPDISNLDYLQLNDLKERIATRMSEMRDNGLGQLRLRFVEEAAAFGLTVEDVVGGQRRRRRILKRRSRKNEEPVEL